MIVGGRFSIDIIRRSFQTVFTPPAFEHYKGYEILVRQYRYADIFARCRAWRRNLGLNAWNRGWYYYGSRPYILECAPHTSRKHKSYCCDVNKHLIDYRVL